jgi:viroplasmin and RNaseH domain-containing protein
LQYHSWGECQAAVTGVSGVQFKGFQTHAEAVAYVEGEVGARGEPAPQPANRKRPLQQEVDSHKKQRAGERSAELYYDGGGVQSSRRLLG